VPKGKLRSYLAAAKKRPATLAQQLQLQQLGEQAQLPGERPSGSTGESCDNAVARLQPASKTLSGQCIRCCCGEPIRIINEETAVAGSCSHDSGILGITPTKHGC